MRSRPHFPLLAKVLSWLALYLLLLGLVFLGFVAWQLGLGLDSLLSGAAGERIKVFGDAVQEKLLDVRPEAWNPVLEPLAREKQVVAGIFKPADPVGFPAPIPGNVLERARLAIPPPMPGNRRPPSWRGGPPGGGGFQRGERPPPPGAEGEDLPPFARDDRPLNRHETHDGKGLDFSSRPVFLIRGDGGDGYWAGVHLVFPGKPGRPPRSELLLIRADRLDGSGMFFDFKPWLWGGLAVLVLSLAFWTPLVVGTTRYIRRLTFATEQVAAGQFNPALPERRNDELGNLGHAIQTMAGRLDHLISGQKRFLGDAAHELCAPLARLRTGLGILEMKLGPAEQVHLDSIETDAQELATLVEEILAFSRAGNRTPRGESIAIEQLVREVVAKEGGGRSVEVKVAAGLTIDSDSTLLGRALGNLIRNARIHAGPLARVVVTGEEAGEWIDLTVSDDGPGVAADELTRLFEPFYRPDRSRSRETGGSGLGLAIVRTAVAACGGEARAALPAGGGFAVTLHLPKTRSVVTGA